MTVYRCVLNFLLWFLELCSYLLPLLWGGEETHVAMASLVLELLQPSPCIVKALVIFTGWVLRLPEEPHPGPPAVWWQSAPALQALGHSTALPSAHAGSALGLYGGGVLGGSLLHEQSNHWVLHLWHLFTEQRFARFFCSVLQESKS